MDDYEKEMKRMQTMLLDCDIPNEPEDENGGESDLVEEDEVVPDSDCYETDSDDLQDESPKKVPRCGVWLGKDKLRGGRKKYPKQQFALSLTIFSERDQDQKD